jgi:hypothetical protein
MAVVRPIPRPIRRIIVRFAAVVCPSELRTERLAGPLLAEFTRYLAALPPHLRLALLGAFAVVDQGARLFGPARGRRLVDLSPAQADAYFRHLMVGAGASSRALAQLLKGLITLCYYELPTVQAAIGYQPGPYVAQVAARRQARYGEAIRRGEAAVYADDPGADRHSEVAS